MTKMEQIFLIELWKASYFLEGARYIFFDRGGKKSAQQKKRKENENLLKWSTPHNESKRAKRERSSKPRAQCYTIHSCASPGSSDNILKSLWLARLNIRGNVWLCLKRNNLISIEQLMSVDLNVPIFIDMSLLESVGREFDCFYLMSKTIKA